MSDSEILLHVTRGTLIESAHRGHIAVSDRTGRIFYSAGDPRKVIYARSSMKPIQALPIIESGAADVYGFTPEEIALLCASHNGEEPHTDAAASMLHKLGLPCSCLQCGPHAPFDAAAADKLAAAGTAPTELHNNCSGKHAGMLALSLRLGAPTDHYMEPGHPVQQLMIRKVSEMSGVPVSQLVLGTDGCGVPVFGLPLHRLAAAYADLGARSMDRTGAQGQAAGRILDALRAHPFQIAGSGRYDTRLIEVTSGRLVGKMGAEGVFTVTYPERELGLALKIEDGTQRAIYPAVTEALVQLGWLEAGEAEALAGFHKPVLHNWKGTPVGEILPVFMLKKQEPPQI
ncbi:asparaginase [Gorillibacterium sp. sgz5001074]|uniref:asparaginase n=1 Tax=Gorillibacterium sp. sgz5001074 TaxID=3446695 RepID=UPI003F681096